MGDFRQRTNMTGPEVLFGRQPTATIPPVEAIDADEDRVLLMELRERVTSRIASSEAVYADALQMTQRHFGRR